MNDSIRVNKKALLVLFILAILVLAVTAIFQTVPGYMDADYYYATALQMVRGEGWFEPFLWNYLDQPLGVPHSAFTYWMPLASILGSLGMWIAGSEAFVAAKIVLYLLAACIPPISYLIAIRLGASPKIAWLAGAAALFPGAYLPLWGTTETFGLYMLLGSLFFLIIDSGFTKAAHFSIRQQLARYFVLGVVIGLMHFSRADGLLWLAGGFVFVAASRYKKSDRIRFDIKKIRIATLAMMCILLGYFLIMGFWFYRNISEFGQLFPPGNSITLWITQYDQTFSFRTDEINVTNWLKSGWGVHIQTWWTAIQMNLKNMVGVQSAVFLFPLILIGLWRVWHLPQVKIYLMMWGITFLVHTFVFPFAGSRGGYLHSGAAFQPFWWALAAIGFDECLRFANNKFGWRVSIGRKILGSGLVVILIGITAYFYYGRVIGENRAVYLWEENYRQYQLVGQWLSEFGVSDEDLVMVNNPPGFFVATNRKSIVIPDGGVDQLLLASQKYGANYLVLERHQANLSDLYTNPQSSPDLKLLAELADTQIYYIAP